jgi:DNA polymerase-4
MDMDAFFASVEQARNPELRGRAIAVVGSSKRTVVTTASYEARARGVKTGMNRFEAERVCPELIFVTANNQLYIDNSIRIMRLLEDFSPLVEPCSIDEAFVDITGTEGCLGSPLEIGTQIKARIKEETGLIASVGIAPNKLISKLASGMRKPDGLFIVKADEIEELLRDLPVDELCGIGKKTTERLAKLGIHTCSELGSYPVRRLKAHFGVTGVSLSQMARGHDTRAVTTAGQEDKVKSLGHSTTLPKDVTDFEEIARVILGLSEAVGARARRHALSGKTITLTIRFSDFRTITRRKTITAPTTDSHHINAIAITLLNAETIPLPIRMLGVSLSGLSTENKQDELFSNVRSDNRLQVMDKVNLRYGGSTLTWGSIAENSDESGVISPAWRPVGARKIDVQ